MMRAGSGIWITAILFGTCSVALGVPRMADAQAGPAPIRTPQDSSPQMRAPAPGPGRTPAETPYWGTSPSPRPSWRPPYPGPERRPGWTYAPAPPPSPYYPPQFRDYVPGQWAWNGYGWIWVPGHWEYLPGPR